MTLEEHINDLTNKELKKGDTNDTNGTSPAKKPRARKPKAPILVRPGIRSPKRKGYIR